MAAKEVKCLMDMPLTSDLTDRSGATWSSRNVTFNTVADKKSLHIPGNDAYVKTTTGRTAMGTAPFSLSFDVYLDSLQNHNDVLYDYCSLIFSKGKLHHNTEGYNYSFVAQPKTWYNIRIIGNTTHLYLYVNRSLYQTLKVNYNFSRSPNWIGTDASTTDGCVLGGNICILNYF